MTVPVLFPLLLPALVLVLARAAALVLAVPVFSNVSMPDFFRVMLALALTALMFPLALSHLPAHHTLGAALAGLGGEILIGLLLGLASGIIFFGADLAGQLIAQSAGFSLGEIVNPQYDSESSTLQQVWFYAALLVFLTAGGAHAIVGVLLDSIREIPPLTLLGRGAAEASTPLLDFLAAALGLTYELALRLAGPALLAVLLATLAVGLLARTVPQLNVYTVGFNVKVALAILLIAVSLPRSAGVLDDALHDSLQMLRDLLTSLARRTPHAG